jgi:hypothetical protein
MNIPGIPRIESRLGKAGETGKNRSAKFNTDDFVGRREIMPFEE